MIPNLNTPQFNPQDVQQTYLIANQLSDVSGWDNLVSQSLGLLYSEWESQVNASIISTVDSINTASTYDSVTTYQNAVYQALVSQEKQALSVWEQAAENSVLSERANFVAGLSNNNLSNTATVASNTNTTTNAQALWQTTFQSNLQNGLSQYQNSLSQLSAEYQNLLLSVQQADTQYQQTMYTIQQNEQNVRVGILAETLQLQQYLHSDLNAATDPAGNKQYMFHQANSDGTVSLNAAGQQLEALVYGVLGLAAPANNAYDESLALNMLADEVAQNLWSDGTSTQNIQKNQFLFHQLNSNGTVTLNTQGQSLETMVYQVLGLTIPANGVWNEASPYNTLQTQLNNPIYPNLSLSQFAGQMQTFLTSEQTYAQSQISLYSGLVSHSYTLPPDVQLMSDYNNGTGQYGQLMRDIANAYNTNGGTDFSGAYADLASALGLGAGLSISSITGADLQASDFNSTSYYVGTLLGFPIGTFSGANLFYSQAGNNFQYFTQTYPVCWGQCIIMSSTAQEQNVEIKNMNYTVHDGNAAADAAIWGSYNTSITNYLNSWTSGVLPAINSWEANVATFQTQYNSWETQKANLLAQAQQNYEQGVSQIQQQESAYLSQMSEYQQVQNAKFASAQTQGASLSSVQTDPAPTTNGASLTSTSNTFNQLASQVPQNVNFDSSNFNQLNALSDQLNTAFGGAQRIALVSAMNNSAYNQSLSAAQTLATSLQNQRSMTDDGYASLLNSLKSQGYSFQYTKGEISGIVNSQGMLLKNTDGTNESMNAFISGASDSASKLGISGSSQNYGYCGQNYANCTQYTTNTYKNVTVNSDGSISVTKSIHDGTVTFNGGDPTKSASFSSNTTDSSFIIPAVGVVKLSEFGVVGGVATASSTTNNPISSSLSRLLSARTMSLSSSAASSSAPLSSSMDFFSNTGWDTSSMNAASGALSQNYQAFSSGLNSLANAAETYTSTLAQIDANGTASADATISQDTSLAQTLLSGGTWQAWASNQVQNAVQGVYASALMNTFNIDPQTASYLAGYKLSHDAAEKAESSMTAVVGKFILSNLALPGIGMFLGNSQGSKLTDDVSGILEKNRILSKSQYNSIVAPDAAKQAFQNYKTQGYEMVVDNYAQSQGKSDDEIKFINGAIGAYETARQANSELAGDGIFHGLDKGINGIFSSINGGTLKIVADVLKHTNIITADQAKSIYKGTDLLQGDVTGSYLDSQKKSLYNYYNSTYQKAIYTSLLGPVADQYGVSAELLGDYAYEQMQQRVERANTRQEKLNQAKQVVELAALAAITIFSLGTSSEVTGPAMAEISAEMESAGVLADSTTAIDAYAEAGIQAEEEAQTMLQVVQGGAALVNAGIDYSSGNKNGVLADIINGAIGMFAPNVGSMFGFLKGGMTLLPEVTWTQGKQTNPLDLPGGTDSKSGWGVAVEIGKAIGDTGVTVGWGPNGSIIGVTPEGSGDTEFPFIVSGNGDVSIGIGFPGPNGSLIPWKGGISINNNGEIELSPIQSAPEESSGGETTKTTNEGSTSGPGDSKTPTTTLKNGSPWPEYGSGGTFGNLNPKNNSIISNPTTPFSPAPIGLIPPLLTTTPSQPSGIYRAL
ncbi:putative large structural protein [Leptospira broomii serovar Hurstbridge str. 5399]|uniref:Large structural protein n=2 Tax=Leptospira broomii TaxID=301541 RepID=T0F3M1_9LEPT|nr:putative large structural protein [Leptospira broomii serovar Hurstbridge str. 5399]